MKILATITGRLILTALLLPFFGCKDRAVPSRQEDHGSFVEEFPPHLNANGWWYLTGYLTNDANPSELYSFQYTQAYMRRVSGGMPMYLLMLAVTNLQTGKHFFESQLKLADMHVYANDSTVSFQPRSLLTRHEDSMDLVMEMKNALLNLHLGMGKGAFWHADNGVLIMGLPDDPEQRSVYYSYTNMPTTGALTLRDDTGAQTVLSVTGKSWFDRQWGTWRLLDAQSSNWEWFSLRFFDDEEVMLFAFPQQSYQDGTYVRKNATSERLTDYSYTPLEYIKMNDSCYSFGWDLTMPGIKQEHYRIIPMYDTEFHLRTFELFARILNDSDELVGYAIVELLPDTRKGMCGEK